MSETLEIAMGTITFIIGWLLGRWYQKNIVKPVDDETEIRKFL